VAVPVLWVYGPSGVGKTEVAWRLAAGLVAAGAPVGYVDIDQLGLCHPERPDDPGRFRLAAANLAAVVAGHRSAGAAAVVVSGVVDSERGVPDVPGLAITACRLRAQPEELQRRLVGRSGADAPVASARADAEALDRRDPPDACVDTTGRTVEEVVGLVRDAARGWVTRTGADAPDAPLPTAGGPVVWLCGATGVGTSTAGFPLFLRHLPGAFLDLDQVGFFPVGGPPDHRMRASVLAGLWANFRAAGAARLTVVGPADGRLDGTDPVALYREALPAATLTVVRLHASPDELTRRVLSRAGGGSWPQPGDPLKGRPEAHLRAVAARSVAHAEALERAGVGDVRVDTDGLDPAGVADAVASASPSWARRG
jgi:hypothetical protein